MIHPIRTLYLLSTSKALVNTDAWLLDVKDNLFESKRRYRRIDEERMDTNTEGTSALGWWENTFLR